MTTFFVILVSGCHYSRPYVRVTLKETKPKENIYLYKREGINTPYRGRHYAYYLLEVAVVGRLPYCQVAHHSTRSEYVPGEVGANSLTSALICMRTRR